MTVSGGDLEQLIARTRCLLLDFDGPICAVFAGYPATQIKHELLEPLVATFGPTPDYVEESSDPFAVLHYAATLGLDVVVDVERALTAAEVVAVRTATETPHARELIDIWRATGRPLAVVSNNSRVAVEAYLAEHQITVDHVIARTHPNPARLKPAPTLITRAVEILDADLTECTLVGDSITDIQGAQAAGVHSIGYANKPGKGKRMRVTGADFVIENMARLVVAIVR